VLLLAVRTYARNLAWQDDLTLATTDVATAPHSFKLHTLLAQELAKQDPQGNIDAAIRELEKANEILHDLPDTQMPQQNLFRLGDAYVLKGNLAGGPSTAEGRGWYEKAIPLFERARTIGQLNERVYDDLQRAHGKPLTERYASQDLYYDLGVAYGSLGRYPASLEVLRYGRDINPERADFYTALSAAYTGLQQPNEAVIALLERVVVEGERPETLAALGQWYGRTPQGACAIENGRLNFGCPLVGKQLCLAQAEVAAAYRAARRPARADEIGKSPQYGCTTGK